MIKHCGDVPYGYENNYVDDYGLTSRFDIYDALISDRVYRRAVDHDRALDIVAENPEIKRWVFLALEKISLC